MKLWLVGCFAFMVHLVLFYSVFDIYFTTPLSKGLTPHASRLPPPAKRLLFIVADGMRADKLLAPMPNGGFAAPFLRSMIETKGIWGISHAAIPTATRPGHVALTAGFYEDPTSVAKDLEGRTIDFDTLFNESRYSWSWDAPTFLNRFLTEHEDRMFSKIYPGDMKWLQGLDPADMDTWVFTEIHRLLDKARYTAKLGKKMAEDKIIYFVHLGGIDHAGYIVRPTSEAYLKHVRLIDNGIKDLIEEFDKHYDNDGNTAYVMTSDHGMTDWGAHGDGTTDETYCPLIAWGAGIKKPTPENNIQQFEDTVSQDWKLSQWKRRDIEQASMASFMASLIGIPFPVNNIYKLPDDLLDLPDQEMAEVLFANMKQLLENYRSIRLALEVGPLSFGFRSYSPITLTQTKSFLTDIEALIAEENYDEAITQSKWRIKLATKGIRHYTHYNSNELWIKLATKGIRHYTHYNSNELWFCTLATFIGWTLYALLMILEEHQSWETRQTTTEFGGKNTRLILQCGAVAAVLAIVLAYAERLTILCTAHVVLPTIVWTVFVVKLDQMRGGIMSTIHSIQHLLPYAAFSIAIVIITALRFYFVHLMYIPILAAIIWPFTTKVKIEKTLLIQWVMSCGSLAILTGMPQGQRPLQYNLVVIGALVAIGAAILIKKCCGKSFVQGKWFRHFGSRFLTFQICVMVLSTCIVYYMSGLMASNTRTPVVLQIVSWVILFLGCLEPLLVYTDVQSRLVTIALSFMGPSILLSTTHETLFMVILAWTLYIWMQLERTIAPANPELPQKIHEINGNGTTNGLSKHKLTNGVNGKATDIKPYTWETVNFAKDVPICRHHITTGDMRRATFLIMILICNLFGTGNTASVNSFDVQDVFCFITRHNPPTMGMLIVLKSTMPAYLLFAVYRAIGIVTHMPTRSFYLLPAVMMNCMGILYLFLATDDNWAQAGQTVGHFILFQGIQMAYFVIHVVTFALTKFKL